MNWVKATGPKGQDVYINLDAIPTMMRADEVTTLYLGGIAMTRNPETGKPEFIYANTQVMEAPEVLVGLPRVVPALPGIPTGAKTGQPLPREISAQLQPKPRVTHEAAAAPRATPAKRSRSA